jgi:hypothetical protein
VYDFEYKINRTIKCVIGNNFLLAILDALSACCIYGKIGSL